MNQGFHHPQAGVEDRVRSYTISLEPASLNFVGVFSALELEHHAGSVGLVHIYELAAFSVEGGGKPHISRFFVYGFLYNPRWVWYLVCHICSPPYILAYPHR